MIFENYTENGLRYWVLNASIHHSTIPIFISYPAVDGLAKLKAVEVPLSGLIV
jgi:hypothetical protein